MTSKVQTKCIVVWLNRRRNGAAHPQSGKAADAVMPPALVFQVMEKHLPKRRATRVENDDGCRPRHPRTGGIRRLGARYQYFRDLGHAANPRVPRGDWPWLREPVEATRETKSVPKRGGPERTRRR